MYRYALLMAVITWGNTSFTASPADYCAYERPIIFGASISAGYSSLGDLFRGIKAAKKGQRYYGKLKSPATRLAGKYFAKPVITNISEIISTMTHSSFGYRQLNQFVHDAKNQSIVRRASILVSLDGFYWPAVFGDCDEAVQGVEDVIDISSRLNKPIILGTVPEEDPSKVRKVFKKFWSPPDKICLQRINMRMKKLCRAQNECYLIDIHSIVKQLNGTGLKYKGKTYFTSDFRKDGIHFTQSGVEFAMDVIEKTLAVNPPNCSP